jgi:hypothetical protein
MAFRVIVYLKRSKEEGSGGWGGGLFFHSKLHKICYEFHGFSTLITSEYSFFHTFTDQVYNEIHNAHLRVSQFFLRTFTRQTI